MPIDMASIIKKAEKCIKPGGSAYRRYQKFLDKEMLGDMRVESGASSHTPQEAAEKFIEVLRKTIRDSGLSENVKLAISEFEYTSPYKLSDGTYKITVYFDEDLSRPSLDEKKYGRIKSLADLYNDGVNHTMHTVRGVWHGKETLSRTKISGEHFMEQAIADFMGNYGAEYGVSDIERVNNYNQ